MVYRKPLGVGQVAEILRVSNKTVLNWIHANALKAFTTYGGHFRIWPADLESFLKTTKMTIPFDFVDERRGTILIIDEDEVFAEKLYKLIDSSTENFVVKASHDGYEGILMIGELHPHLLILGVDSLRSRSLHILELVKARKEKNCMKIMLMCRGRDVRSKVAARYTNVDVLIPKEEEPHLVLQHIREFLLEGKSEKQS